MEERPEWNSNPDCCDAGAVLHQLSYQLRLTGSWSLYDKPTDSGYLQACKLARDIGHLSGKFEGFDWQILSLTGHVAWALPL